MANDIKPVNVWEVREPRDSEGGYPLVGIFDDKELANTAQKAGKDRTVDMEPAFIINNKVYIINYSAELNKVNI